MNIDRTQINMTRLRSNSDFQLLIELLKIELKTKREQYEDTVASEFLRGQVVALKDLVDELTKPTALR